MIVLRDLLHSLKPFSGISIPIDHCGSTDLRANFKSTALLIKSIRFVYFTTALLYFYGLVQTTLGNGLENLLAIHPSTFDPKTLNRHTG